MAYNKAFTYLSVCRFGSIRNCRSGYSLLKEITLDVKNECVKAIVLVSSRIELPH